MSSIAECKELFNRYSIARIPFIAIDSIERSRTLGVLQEVAAELGLSFLVHTLSDGVYELGNEKKILCDDKSIYGALDYFGEQIKRRQNLTLILTEAPDLSNENEITKQIMSLATLSLEVGAVVMVISNNPIWNQLQRLGMIIKVDLPDEEEMYEVIKEYIDDSRTRIPIEWDNSDIREAASMLCGVTRIEAENVIAALLAKDAVTKQDLDEIRYSKDRLFADISGLEKIEVEESVKDVGGLDGLQKWLQEKKELLKPEKRDEMKRRGLQSPRGILLVGVPGCGKSLSAKSISATWRLPLYRLDFATVQGEFVGQTERQLREALQTAEDVSPCVLWIDEIEKGLSGAGSSNDGGVSTRMVGQFLFWLQECKKQVFVVATANDVSMLPSELLRRGRFDELFFVDLPTAEERRKIIEIYMRRYLQQSFTGAFADKVVEQTDGFTGADLESTVRDIAYQQMAVDGFQLNEHSIIESFNNVIPLSMTSPERIEAIRDWGKERAVPASGRPIGSAAINTDPGKPKIRRILGQG